ncbi:MAG TPA: tetratricopeptide repeat protein [Gammaproteobacteria bacterium]|nr:tetratricopeptide repeat protein [Gammaproteobacteria bacterium]
MGIIENLEGLLAKGRDNAMLRLGLGNAYLQQGDYRRAAEHLGRAVEQDPGYSAAWKGYARALTELGRPQEAVAAYEAGIAAATDKGDRQAAKEMGVFLKRLKKTALP